jgi:pyruvate dehydrogenase E1 component alpha subunit
MAVDPSVKRPADPYQPTTAAQAAARGAAGLRGAPNPSEVIAGLRATSNAEDLVQLLSPEGVYTPHEDFPIEVTSELLRGLYRDMVLVRRFDREGNALQRQGQLNIWVPLLGQEAAQIGAGRALRPKDMAFPSYREHGVAWCRGIDPTELLGIFRGTDQCGWDPKATRFNSYTIVIGNQVLNATGYAMGQRFDGVIGAADTGRCPRGHGFRRRV